MATTVFISHAGADTVDAATVTKLLTDAGIKVRFDRNELRLGDSFLTFMESALSHSDYCLLLWSQSASKAKWVRVEWEAALYRSISQSNSFLVIGRLDDFPPPALLSPRLRVNLFPTMQPGVGQIIETWRADRGAETETLRPVASAASINSTQEGSDTVYITSDEFGITVPLDINLQVPAGVYIDQLIQNLELPMSLDYKGHIGVRFTYRLMNDNKALERGVSMSAQNVHNNAVLWLEATMKPYSRSNPMTATPTKTVLRGSEVDQAEVFGRRGYLATIKRNGLGPM